jgi:endonuclease YncB( thermonuclease family)
MMKALQFMLALVVAGVIAGTMLVARNAESPEHAESELTAAARATHSKPEPAGKSAGKGTETSSARNVGGGGVAAALEGSGPLERIAALPQPTLPTAPQAAASIPEKQFLRWRLVYHAVATSAGILQAGGTALVLPGIDIISADETCPMASGASWPCGMVARTAFRNYLKGRAVNCRLPDVPPDKAIVAECLLQGQDPAAWLVERGWARLPPDSPLAELAETAKSSGRGIYGAPPTGVEIKLP